MADQDANRIEDAINEALKTLDGHRDGDILVEWALIAYVVNPEDEEADGYPMLFSNGEIATYKARGLFETALHMLNTGRVNE